MRPTLLITAAAIAASLASAAYAQTARLAPAAPPAVLSPQPIDTTPKVTGADMDAINAHTESDDATMQGLVSIRLAAGNARMRQVRPALSFRGLTFIPPSLIFGVTGPNLFHIAPPRPNW